MRQRVTEIRRKTLHLAGVCIFLVCLVAHQAAYSAGYNCFEGDITIRQAYEKCKNAAADRQLPDDRRAFAAYKAGLMGTFKEINASSIEVLGYLLIAHDSGIKAASVELGEIYSTGYRDISKNLPKAIAYLDSVINLGGTSYARKKALLKRAAMKLNGEGFAVNGEDAQKDLFRAAFIHDPADEFDLYLIAGHYSAPNSPLYNRYMAYFWEYMGYKMATTAALKGLFYTELEKSELELEAIHLQWIRSEVDKNPTAATLFLPEKAFNYFQQAGLK